MIVENAKFHLDMPFEEYLKLPGISYSGIKSGGVPFVRTDKMELGTQVHNYLLTPGKYNHENNNVVKPIVQQLKSSLGSLLKYLKPEVVVTADFIHDGFVMKYKGRIDLCIYKKVVLDIKISELPDIQRQVEFFGYNYQLSGYCLAIGSPLAFILSVNPKNKVTKLVNIPINEKWWEHQVTVKGEPL